MSTFWVPKAHIDALLTAALQWGVTAWDPDASRLVALDEADATNIGRDLWLRNFDATQREYYEDADEPEPPQLASYTFERLPGAVDPVVILKAVLCFDYQMSHDPHYQRSDAAEFLQNLHTLAITRLPGYEEAPWAIDSRDVFLPADS